MNPDPRNHAPTAQDAAPAPSTRGSADQDEWLALAQSAYHSSTTYVNSNYRKNWEDSIRAFNSQHPTDSKFSQPAFEKRSKVYRPKTRALIRKTEAAGACAFFSSKDVIVCTPNDQDNKLEAANAAVMKQLLQYRLTKSIPWFLVVQGALQDAQVTAACAHVHWDYREETPKTEITVQRIEVAPVPPEFVPGVTLDKPQQALGLVNPALLAGMGGQLPPQQTPLAAQQGPSQSQEYPAQGQLPAGALQATQNGQLSDQPTPVNPAVPQVQPAPPVVLKDMPVVDLIPIENIRIDPGANWMDPVNSSPYVIHLMPMYVQEIKERMNSGEWETFPDAAISASTETTPDSTRAARQKDREDPYTSDSKSVDDYEIVWVQRHIHRREGKDWEFYMLGDVGMLTVPALLTDSVLHGKRPYVIGTTVIETHKIMPSTIPQLSKELQSEINEVANQRLDNVKFVLNKKFLVKRGKEADINGLLRNVPGGVAMFDDPTGDVRELTWQDVTQSSFQEHQGLSMEMDELLGNFNPAQLMVAGGAQNPARNMAMLQGASGTLVEYGLLTFVETFIQPVLRQVVLLEQHYETDKMVMAIAGKKAKLFQKFGVDQITDELLKQEMTLTVDVGMGATDPMARLNRFLSALTKYTEILKNPTPGLDMKEVGAEIWGFLGYQDGTRFFTNENPQLLQLQEELKKMSGVVAQLQAKLGEKKEAQQIALQKVDMTTKASVQRQMITAKTSMQNTVVKEAGLNKRALATHWTALHKHHEPGAPPQQPLRFQ